MSQMGFPSANADKAGNGRPPYPLETILRIHLLQNGFALSDPATEEALVSGRPLTAEPSDRDRRVAKPVIFEKVFARQGVTGHRG